MDREEKVDPRDTRRFFEAKAEKRAKDLDARFERAKTEATRIIEMLVRDFQPRRIWQWGSLLDRDRFSEISDIDIAIEGIADQETFFALYGATMELATFPLDLVELERIEPLHAQSIRKTGRLVHERP